MTPKAVAIQMLKESITGELGRMRPADQEQSALAWVKSIPYHGENKPKPRPLGSTQAKVLEALKNHKGWQLNCGWMWTTMRATEKIMEQLVARGLAIKTKDEKGRDQYRATEES